MVQKKSVPERERLFLFPVAVLYWRCCFRAPSSASALRAADREVVYVERSLEAALLAEVNLVATGYQPCLTLASDLKMEAAAIPLESGSMRS